MFRAKQMDAEDGVVWSSVPRLLSLEPQAVRLSWPPSRVRAAQAGAYLSPFKGRGMEFEEARPYQPGDDVRHIDWRVTARTNRPHSKVFREERERPVLIAVDCRSSMAFGTRNSFKSVLAIELAALLAWRAKKGGDRVGGLIFNEHRHVELKPASSARAVLYFLHQLSQFSQHQVQAHHSSTLATQSLARLRQVARPGSLISLIGDFRQRHENFEADLSALARHSQVDLIQVFDPIEQAFPDAGQLQLSDGERQLMIDTQSRQGRHQYQEQFNALCESLTAQSRSQGFGLYRVSTAQGLEGFVTQFQSQRRGRRA